MKFLYLNGGAKPKLGYYNPYHRIILDAACTNTPQGSSWQSSCNNEHESFHPFETPMEDPMEEDPNPMSQKIYAILFSVCFVSFFFSIEGNML